MKWFQIIRLMNEKAGDEHEHEKSVSIKDIQREISVTYKTAYRMRRAIREIQSQELQRERDRVQNTHAWKQHLKQELALRKPKS